MRFICRHILMILILAVLGVGASAGAGEKKAGKKTAQKQKLPDNQLIDIVKKRGKLIVAQVGVDQPPFFWKERKDGKDVWVGYEMDLARQIADKLGVELEMLRLGEDYNEVIQVVNEGKADIGISNVSDTEARREFVDFTQPYLVSRVGMIVAIDDLERDGVQAIEPHDLNNPAVKVAIAPNSNYAFVIDELMPTATRIPTPQGTFEVVAAPVINGEAHVVVDDGLVLHLGMQQNPQLAKRLYLHVLDEYDDPLSICLPKNQAALRDFINTIIQEIEAIEPVTLEYLVDRYMK